jgi:hypothetical protein
MMVFFVSGNFTWVVGFGAKVLSPIKVTEALPTFIELAFLRKQNFDIRDAIYRSFDRIDLLTHTSVLLITQGAEKAEDGATAKMVEFAVSNEYSPWGLSGLPKCPTCDSNMFMKAIIDKERCQLYCHNCRLKSPRFSRPAFVESCGLRHLDPNKFFILPFPHPFSPWSGLPWGKKEF